MGHPAVRGLGVEQRCSAWNIHLYVTKKCGKRRFLWIAAVACSLIAPERFLGAIYDEPERPRASRDVEGGEVDEGWGEFCCRGGGRLLCWLRFGVVPFWNSNATPFQYEDSFPHRVSRLRIPGSRAFACAGGLRGLAGVPNGDSGCGWNCGCGALCALAVAIIP